MACFIFDKFEFSILSTNNESVVYDTRLSDIIFASSYLRK